MDPKRRRSFRSDMSDKEVEGIVESYHQNQVDSPEKRPTLKRLSPVESPLSCDVLSPCGVLSPTTQALSAVWNTHMRLDTPTVENFNPETPTASNGRRREGAFRTIQLQTPSPSEGLTETPLESSSASLVWNSSDLHLERSESTFSMMSCTSESSISALTDDGRLSRLSCCNSPSGATGHGRPGSLGRTSMRSPLSSSAMNSGFYRREFEPVHDRSRSVGGAEQAFETPHRLVYRFPKSSSAQDNLSCTPPDSFAMRRVLSDAVPLFASSNMTTATATRDQQEHSPLSPTVALERVNSHTGIDLREECLSRAPFPITLPLEFSDPLSPTTDSCELKPSMSPPRHPTGKPPIYQSSTPCADPGKYAPQLPLVQNSSAPQCTTISVQTAAGCMDGTIDLKGRTLRIIDCRFPFEYDGGHLADAINIFRPDEVMNLLFPPEAGSEAVLLSDEVSPPSVPVCAPTDWSNTCILFHCEYSQKRGPDMWGFVRRLDRYKHTNSYPELSYPEMYVIDCGFKKFYETFGASGLCAPTYVHMKDNKNETRRLIKELNTLWDATSKLFPNGATRKKRARHSNVVSRPLALDLSGN